MAGTAQADHGNPHITWDQSPLELVAPAGSTQQATILFKATDGVVDDLNVRITGPVSSVLDADPARITPNLRRWLGVAGDDDRVGGRQRVLPRNAGPP